MFTERVVVGERAPELGRTRRAAEVGFLLGGGAVGNAHSNVRSRGRSA